MILPVGNATPSDPMILLKTNAASPHRKPHDPRISAIAKAGWEALKLMGTVLETIACFCVAVIVTAVATIHAVVAGVALAIIYALKCKKDTNFVEMAHMIMALVKEFFIVIPCILLYPFRMFPKDLVTEAKTAKDQPILMVPGYLHNSTAWFYHRQKLKQAGYKNIFTINPGNPFASIEQHAERVQKKAAEIAKLTGTNKLHLIGHSMGGLISSYYACVLAPKGTVTDIVTLGSPLKGTKLALCGPEQMKYESNFVKQLKQHIEGNSFTKFYHLGSDSDLIIQPQDSAWLGGEHKIFPKLGHLAYLYSPRVSEAILEWLEKVPNDYSA